jgi:hypothetical protein
MGDHKARHRIGRFAFPAVGQLVAPPTDDHRHVSFPHEDPIVLRPAREEELVIGPPDRRQAGRSGPLRHMLSRKILLRIISSLITNDVVRNGNLNPCSRWALFWGPRSRNPRSIPPRSTGKRWLVGEGRRGTRSAGLGFRGVLA